MKIKALGTAEIFKTDESEASIQAKIIEILKLRRFLVIRINSGVAKNGRLKFYRICNTGATDGLSDLLAVKNGRAYFIEVKRRGKKLRECQKDFFELAAEYGAETIRADSWEGLLDLVNRL